MENAYDTGTYEGTSTTDYDQPYVFGRKPRYASPFPFTTLQYGRLLILRGRFEDGKLGQDDAA